MEPAKRFKAQERDREREKEKLSWQGKKFEEKKQKLCSEEEIISKI